MPLDSAGNGGRPGPYAALVERIDAHDDRLDDQDARFGRVLREVGGLASRFDAVEKVADRTYHAALTAATEAQAVRADVREEREARLRECSIRHCDVPGRAPLPSIDYDALTDTGIVREAEALRVRNAELEATLAERDRQSERARRLAEHAEARADVIDERRWTKAQKIGAGVLALLAAGGGGAGVLELVRSLLGH